MSLIPKAFPVRINLLFLILALVLFGVFLIRYNFTQDDAYISFRHAANFINGHGLVFNAGERVEGYTNFLWIIFIITGLIAKINPLVLTKVIGIVSGTATLAAVFWFGWTLDRRQTAPDNYIPGLAVLFLAAFAPLAYWAISGMESVTFALLFLLAVGAYVRRSYSVTVFIASTCLNASPTTFCFPPGSSRPLRPNGPFSFTTPFATITGR